MPSPAAMNHVPPAHQQHPPVRSALRLIFASAVLLSLMSLSVLIRNGLGPLTRAPALPAPSALPDSRAAALVSNSDTGSAPVLDTSGEAEDSAFVAATDHQVEYSDNADATSASPKRPAVTDWKSSFRSEACLAHRSRPVGRAEQGQVGLGQRALCTDYEETEEARKEIVGSVDVSISHRIIYIPVMKAGTQMFQEVLKKRFGAVRVNDRDLARVLRKGKLELDDMFVFTFVRSPLSMFRSGYGEMSLYGAHAKISRSGFMLIPQTAEHEPERAIECLRNVRTGLFTGLVPAHLFTQVWKTQRCMGRARRPVPIHFIGHLENAAADWMYVEERLGVAHVALPVIHSSDSAKERVMAKDMIKFDQAGADLKFSNLTRQACEYYESDFECFGYDNSLCVQ